MKKIFIALFVLFLLTQFIQPKKNRAENGKAQIAELQNTLQLPDNVHQIFTVACYDCHSNHTRYPWYDNITPVNFWVKQHIDEGKQKLNFSDFEKYTIRRKDHKYEEIAEEVQEEKMPLPSYLYTHFDARLSEEQKSAIINWAEEQRANLDYDKGSYSEEGN